jgi:hypothetical protein
MIDEESGDTTQDEVQQAIIDTLESIECVIEEKVENIAKLINSISADENALKAEEERIHNRRMTIVNRKAAIKKYLQEQLERAKINKVKTSLFTVYTQNNRPSVVADENDERLKKYPEIWTKREDTLNKAKIYELLKEGKEIEGVSLSTTKSLRIR